MQFNLKIILFVQFFFFPILKRKTNQSFAIKLFDNILPYRYSKDVRYYNLQGYNPVYIPILLEPPEEIDTQNLDKNTVLYV